MQINHNKFEEKKNCKKLSVLQMINMCDE